MKPIPPVASPEDHDRVFEEACALLTPRIQLHGRHSAGMTTEDSEHLQTGICMLDAVLRFFPGNWSALWVKGKALQALGRSEESCAAFASSFEINRNHPDVAREYMFECLRLGRAEDGLRIARHAVGLNPGDAGLHANLAIAFLISGDPHAALDAVLKALTIDPADPISLNVRRLVIAVLEGKRPKPRNLGELGG